MGEGRKGRTLPSGPHRRAPFIAALRRRFEVLASPGGMDYSHLSRHAMYFPWHSVEASQFFWVPGLASTFASFSQLDRMSVHCSTHLNFLSCCAKRSISPARREGKPGTWSPTTSGTSVDWSFVTHSVPARPKPAVPTAAANAMNMIKTALLVSISLLLVDFTLY